MPHPAVEFMLPILQKRTAIRKVIEAVRAGEIEVPGECGRCGAEFEADMYRFRHLSGYDEEHIYDIEWLCLSCDYTGYLKD
jgi:hypothetical protein